MSNTDDQVPSVYVHEPLDLTKACIRTVRILPGPVDSPVRCTIRTITLTEAYRAVSYTWGSPSSNDIILNGYKFSVRDTLYAFLVQARSLEIQHDIFIDAICINQENASEKNHQVRQMAQIYRKAELVYVWPTSSELLPPVYQAESVCLTSGQALSPKAAREMREFCGKLTWLSKAHQPRRVRRILRSFSPAQWSRLVSLCKAPYWTRLWVCQEVLLARKVRLLFGHNDFSWGGFCRIAEYAHRVSDSGTSIPSRVTEAPWDRISRFQKTSSLPSSTLLELIRTLGPMQCADTRDRIYGLLGLASDGEHIAVDYEEHKILLCLRLYGLYSHEYPDPLGTLTKYLDIAEVKSSDVVSDIFGFHDLSSIAPNDQSPKVRLVAKVDKLDLYALSRQSSDLSAIRPLQSLAKWTCSRCCQAADQLHDARYLFDLDYVPRLSGQLNLRRGRLVPNALPSNLIIVENTSGTRTLCLKCEDVLEIEEYQHHVQEEEEHQRQELEKIRFLPEVHTLRYEKEILEFEIITQLDRRSQYAEWCTSVRTRIQERKASIAWWHARHDCHPILATILPHQLNFSGVESRLQHLTREHLQDAGGWPGKGLNDLQKDLRWARADLNRLEAGFREQAQQLYKLSKDLQNLKESDSIVIVREDDMTPRDPSPENYMWEYPTYFSLPSHPQSASPRPAAGSEARRFPEHSQQETQTSSSYATQPDLQRHLRTYHQAGVRKSDSATMENTPHVIGDSAVHPPQHRHQREGARSTFSQHRGVQQVPYLAPRRGRAAHAAYKSRRQQP